MVRRLLPWFLLLAASPSLAQPADIEADPDAAWVHQWTAFKAPPMLEGFERTRISDYTQDQLNVAVTYRDRESGTTATIYIFRPGLVSVPIWKDRAILSIGMSRDTIGELDLASTVGGNFTPRSGGGTNSGYIAYGPVSGKSARSTGLALFPYNEWLIKIRMTSNGLSAEDLAGRIVALLSAIDLPRASVEYPAAEDIAACRDGLEFSDGDKRGATPMPLLVLMSVQASSQRGAPKGDEGEPKPVEDPQYCRDASSGLAYGVYRPRKDERSYVLAIGDAGLSVSVAHYEAASLFDGRPDRYRGTGSKEYWPMAMNEQRTSIYTPFQGLPSPRLVLETLESEPPIAAVEFKPEGGTQVILPSQGEGQAAGSR